MNPPRGARSILVGVAFLAYVITLGFGTWSHELWGDELCSWNIAKASAHLGDLFVNARYTGHPPLWFLLLWLISRLSHALSYLRLLQFSIATAVAAVVLFRSPFPVLARVLMVFGYYFLFEYGVLARNYAIGVLLTFCLCLLHARLGDRPRPRWFYPLHYSLIFLLGNVHLLACFLAISIHAALLFNEWRGRHTGLPVLLRHGLLGVACVALPLWYIFPPGDSNISLSYFLHTWNIRQLSVVFLAPLKSLLPLPAWWTPHWWNTHFLVELHRGHGWVRGISYALVVALLGAVVFIFRRHSVGLVLVTVNLGLTALFGLVFPLTTTRYVGFLFIGFLASCWFALQAGALDRTRQRLINAIMLVHVLAGVFAVQSDLRAPFSNSARVVELAATIPAGAPLASDYWCLDNVAAFLDRPVYCVQQESERSFLSWDKESAHLKSYQEGLAFYFDKTRASTVFMFSTSSPSQLASSEAELFRSFQVQLAGQYEGAIEPWSNVYLYRVTRAGLPARGGGAGGW